MNDFLFCIIRPFKRGNAASHECRAIECRAIECRAIECRAQVKCPTSTWYRQRSSSRVRSRYRTCCPATSRHVNHTPCTRSYNTLGYRTCCPWLPYMLPCHEQARRSPTIKPLPFFSKWLASKIWILRCVFCNFYRIPAR